MELSVKVINAGKCMMCGKPIKLVVHRGYGKLPNILFCEECEQDIEEQEKVDDWRDRLDKLEREEYYESKLRKEQE